MLNSFIYFFNQHHFSTKHLIFHFKEMRCRCWRIMNNHKGIFFIINETVTASTSLSKSNTSFRLYTGVFSYFKFVCSGKYKTEIKDVKPVVFLNNSALLLSCFKLYSEDHHASVNFIFKFFYGLYFQILFLYVVITPPSSMVTSLLGKLKYCE